MDFRFRGSLVVGFFINLKISNPSFVFFGFSVSRLFGSWFLTKTKTENLKPKFCFFFGFSVSRFLVLWFLAHPKPKPRNLNQTSMFYALVLVCLSFLFKSCSFQLLFWAIGLAVLEHWWNRLPEKYITLKRNSKTIIWGMGGAGKSQLANKLGKKYNISVLHLDDIKFGPGWRLRSKAAMRISLTCFLEENKHAWIMEGLLSGGEDVCRDLVLELCHSQANHIILLQPFIWIRLFRILKRSVFRRLSLETSRCWWIRESFEYMGHALRKHGKPQR